MNNTYNVIESLKSNPLVSEIEVCNSDECVGIESDELYVTITHHFDLIRHEDYVNLCDGSRLESVDCSDRETGEYETQVVLIM